MSFDAIKFRQALGTFATGVTVVTARAPNDELLGVTVSSFNSVSLDPPLVLFSLDRRASSVGAYEAASHFAVNVLDRSQIELCEKFAQPLSDKWNGVAFEDGAGRAPVLPGSLAVFECRAWATYDGGDHVIFVGEVVNLRARHDGSPLLFHGGAYKSVSGLES
ncbi:MAG: flavin reductase family protein [Rhodospirillales bacterium]